MPVREGNEVTVIFVAAMNQLTRANGFFFQLITATDMKNCVCIVCGFLYEEAVARPAEGIVSGTRWADAPANRTCACRGVAKADFEVVEI